MVNSLSIQSAHVWAWVRNAMSVCIYFEPHGPNDLAE
ncbi:hypothetical protein ALP83_100367 [Pseudomonas syringae pv. actinidiae]|uniref:Uncharacterized protein n=1 Tax=Pseudomonas syringae pv. actinidiae TaxID=103796 RepID=A0A7Z6UFS4_PSESF|nr:hypothetical protein ALP83_100367 [Pseudomonas syringae pv. actinidiae]